MAIEQVDSHQRSVDRMNRVREWLKRETNGLFPDLRLALKLIRTSSSDLQTQIDAAPAYLDAVTFNDNITPKEGAKYEWAWEYAKFQFERADRIYRDLDDKANDIIKYLGGGTGLFTLAALANVTRGNVYVIAASLPAFAFAVISVALAACARQPNPISEPPQITGAYKYAETFLGDEPGRSAIHRSVAFDVRRHAPRNSSQVRASQPGDEVLRVGYWFASDTDHSSDNTSGARSNRHYFAFGADRLTVRGRSVFRGSFCGGFGGCGVDLGGCGGDLGGCS